MNKNSSRILFSIFTFAVAAGTFYRSDENPVPTGEKIVQAHAAAPIRDAGAQTHSSWPGSPFGSDPDIRPEQPILAPHVLARQQKMESMGYGSPPEYYSMDLKTLQEQAKKGDGDAMLQLAEQYFEETSYIRSDPGFPTNQDPRELAKQYLAEAVGAGFSRAATLLSKRHFDENNIVDAYAWKLISENLGDGKNKLWGQDSNQFAVMTVEQRQLAVTKATTTMRTIEATLPKAMERYLGIPKS